VPNVDGKQFPYTAQGIREAQNYSDVSGMPVDRAYQRGGPIGMYGEGGKVTKKRAKNRTAGKANVAKKGIDGASRVKTKTKYC
jgi:hypothetical protein